MVHNQSPRSWFQEAEIESLRSDLSRSRSELEETRRSLFAAEDAEKAARAQLASERHRTTTLERMVANAQPPPPTANSGSATAPAAGGTLLNRDMTTTMAFSDRFIASQLVSFANRLAG